MNTTISFLLTTFLCFSQSISQQSEEDCNCPRPTKQEFLNVCHAIYVKEICTKPGFESYSYEYQRLIWEMSCADPNKDNLETAIKKIQCMWNKYREDFTCDNYVDSLASDRNIIKFCIDRGFTAFVSEAAKKYHLNMNFIDIDGQTVLDFIMEQIELKNNQPPIDEYGVKELYRLYEMLKKDGAKHANEL